jgi:transporter family protein
MAGSIYFVIGAALGMGLWNVFVSSASRQMHPILGAVVCELTAVTVGTLILLPVFRSGPVAFSARGLVMVMLAGLSVLSADYFALKAYHLGLPVSIGGPIIIGGSILVVSLAGVLAGDGMTLLKAASMLMILVGASILAALSG